jgi:plasmid stability protein
MASIILRTLSPQVHRALKARAEQSGRTVEAEIVEIVEIAVRGKAGGGMGMDLGALLRGAGVGGGGKSGGGAG